MKKKRKKANKLEYGDLDLVRKVRSANLYDNKNRITLLEGKPDLGFKI